MRAGQTLIVLDRRDLEANLRRSEAAHDETESAITAARANFELARVTHKRFDKSIYHKNLMPVTYVAADLAGVIESPVYAMLKVGPEIDRIQIPKGYRIEEYTAGQPPTDSRYALKCDGEWQITYEVFRDLGLAFGAALILIYILIVGWFRSFVTPLVITAAIPFSLVGILPAHGLLGAVFTATSMIGFIAGAGIVVGTRSSW